MLKKRFFKTNDNCEVTFELEQEGAETIELVCEHNEWEPMAMRKLKAGPFRTKIRLPKDSKLEFRYRVDAETWINDPEADDYVVNEFGSKNGIVDTTNVQ